MFKSIRTKIFISFALLSLFQLGLVAIFFGRIVMRETETHILDALSRRAENKAREWALAKGKRNDLLFLSENLSFNRKSAGIPEDEILRLVPTVGSSVVTPCNDHQRIEHLCAFAAVDSPQGWIIDTTPKTTVVQILRKLTRELAGLGFLLVLMALVATYLISIFLLRPLHRFASATRRVALGSYDHLDLPTDRGDEIGLFALSFQKMLSDLQEREKKIAHSARLASIGQMGASIAHEVKNPLMSMQGYAKMLAKQDLRPEAKEAAEIIAKEADRCSQILGQMLRFSRSETNERKPYSLKEVLHSAIALVRSEAKKSQIQLEENVDVDSVLVGNAQQIQQVVLNILMNAIHASSNSAQRLIKIRAFERNTFVVIEIEDHGSGIPAQIKDRIFDPFFSTKDKRDGTGLGLSVALELVHDHGGGLYFDSTEGKGTTFTIELPLPPSSARGLA